MKKILIAVTLLSLGQAGFSKTVGFFFNVSLTGMTLSLSPKANHLYPDAGLLITSPDYTLSNANAQCSGWPNTNGYCKFSASPANPASITINGPAGVLKFKLCLSLWGNINCQNYTIDITEQARCSAAGGKIVLGSDNCWIEKTVLVWSTVLRCSTVCSDAGLVLQQPGPTNSATLAENVCAAYGHTNAPQINQPNPMTWIGTADSAGPTSCYWQNTTGTNWDNPNNGNYNGTTGKYMCPCI